MGFHWVMMPNPLTYCIEEFRGCVIGGVVPDRNFFLVPYAADIVTCGFGNISSGKCAVDLQMCFRLPESVASEFSA